MRGPICYHIIQITVASKHFVFLGQIFLRNQIQKAPFDVAKCHLGKVKLEQSWSVVSAFAVNDLCGSPWGFCWASFVFVANVALALLPCLLIISY